MFYVLKLFTAVCVVPVNSRSALFYSPSHEVDGTVATLSLMDESHRIETLQMSVDDRRYRSIAATDTHIYWVTDSSIERASLNELERSTLVGGWVDISLTGFNFLPNEEDTLKMTINGIECQSFQKIEPNTIICTYLAPEVSNPNLTLAVDNASVITRYGSVHGDYVGDFVESKLADKNLLPIITGMVASRRSFYPHALAIDSTTKIMYWSNRATGSIERSNIDGSEASIFLSNVGIVCSIALDERNRNIYYSSIDRSVIARSSLSSAHEIVVLSGLQCPMGIALDSYEETLYFVHSSRFISKISIQPGARSDVHTIIYRSDITRIESIFISRDVEIDAQVYQTEQKMYWTESGAVSAIMQSSTSGTNIKTVLSELNSNILWPSGLALISNCILYTEYLGKIFYVEIINDNIAGSPKELVSENYSAMIEITSRVSEFRKKGIYDSIFLTPPFR